MQVILTNAQQAVSVNVGRLRRVADCAARRLRLRAPGQLLITLISSRRMQMLNKRFLRHDRPTDVLTFRYDEEAIAGEILIDPIQAKRYAREHAVSSYEELQRYLVHGLLHWLGHDDRTPEQQRRMRQMENRVLQLCARA